MTCCMRIVTIVVYDIHTFTFKGKTFKLKDIGPIGLHSTGAIARIGGGHWAKQRLKILKDCRIRVELCHLLRNFVDYSNPEEANWIGEIYWF